MLWLGVNGLSAMVLLQQGLQREKAGRVGILANSVVIFTYIFQVALTDDKGNGSSAKHREVAGDTAPSEVPQSLDGALLSTGDHAFK